MLLSNTMKKRLLVIEDHAPMRRNIALLLELEAYEVFTADNGKTGLEQARQQRPDLILCDVMMPEMDGYTVVQELRGDAALAATPFIFLTVRSDRGDVRVGMNFGADDYLTKPVLRDDLLAAVQVRLGRAETHERQLQAASGQGGFNPDFSGHLPLQKAMLLTPREAEVLLWVAQGKSNGDVATILQMSEKTVKQHLGSVFQKIGVESRTAASLRAVEVLSSSGS